MKPSLVFAGIIGAFLTPLISFAAGPQCSAGLQKVLCVIGDLIGMLTPIVVAGALLVFFWGLAVYVLSFSGDDKEKKKGRDIMMYGVLTLFVMVSVWGLVQVLQNTFLDGGDNPKTMSIPYIIPKN